MRVLVVEDDPAVASSLRSALSREKLDVLLTEDGEAALECLGSRRFDLVILDVMLPGLDGLEVCRRLRASGDTTPVLMLTARDLVTDRVAGLDAGADDYLVKPFAVAELRARLRALVRRAALPPSTASAALRFADLELNRGSREVHRGRRELSLTRTEFALLELFLTNPRQVLTREVIFDRVWGYDFGPASNQLWVYVSYLRRKLEEDGEPRLIHNERGVGYVLREPATP